MALIQMSRDALTNLHEDELVDELAAELRNPSESTRQPLIIEEQLNDPKLLTVFVVWEKWRLISAGARGRVIMEAYRRAQSQRHERIAHAIPATTEEAVQLGLLPYAIEPMLLKTERDNSDEVYKLMQAEGAVATPSGLVLRYPRLDWAHAAYERLNKQIPDCWAIVKIEHPSED